jgi:hypothetical protein
VAVAAGIELAIVCVPSPASATPGKSAQWSTLVGTCDGVPAVVADPPGPGPTGFEVNTGRMGVGPLFQGINIVTGEIGFQDEYGTALQHANQPVVTCDFPIPPELSPDGTSNWDFRVTGFFRS